MVFAFFFFLRCACAQEEEEVPVAQFVAEKTRDGELWVLDDDMLFTVDGACEKGVSVIGYVRPETIARFCIAENGVTSQMSRRHFRGRVIRKAPSLKDLAKQIDDHPERCWPSTRGLFFETIELLCFAMGRKPAVVRQRQARSGGAASTAVLLGVPANMFVPQTQSIFKWLLTQSVWRGLSKNHWGDGPDPPFEHSVVFARDPLLGQFLVDLHVQDASVPAQPSEYDKALYIARVGLHLGYPEPQVRNYLETSGMLSDFPHIDAVLAHAREEHRFPTINSELPGFRAFLDNDSMTCSPDSLRSVVAPLDALAFHDLL